MEWIKKLLQFFSLTKEYMYFFAYNWETNDKRGTGNVVIRRTRKVLNWDDVKSLKDFIKEKELKNYPDASVMIIHYCEMK